MRSRKHMHDIIASNIFRMKIKVFNITTKCRKRQGSFSDLILQSTRRLKERRI